MNGREQGIREGRKEGREEGRKEGERNKAIEIAKNMLRKKMPIEVIEEITGLSKDDIEK